jgi:hypothetical protein
MNSKPKRVLYPDPGPRPPAGTAAEWQWRLAMIRSGKKILPVEDSSRRSFIQPGDAVGPTDKVWWCPYWYLRKGQKLWEVVWMDPTMCTDRGSTPQATVEAQYGELDGFEVIEGVQPLHVREVLAGVHFSYKLPKRKRGDRCSRVEMVVPAQ